MGMDIFKITSFKSACQLTTLGGKGKDLEVCACYFTCRCQQSPLPLTLQTLSGVPAGFSSSLGPLGSPALWDHCVSS